MCKCCRPVESRMWYRTSSLRLGSDEDADWTWAALDEAAAFSLAFRCGVHKSRESLGGAWQCLAFRS